VDALGRQDDLQGGLECHLHTPERQEHRERGDAEGAEGQQRPAEDRLLWGLNQAPAL
jgi:hypothetical protein